MKPIYFGPRQYNPTDKYSSDAAEDLCLRIAQEVKARVEPFNIRVTVRIIQQNIYSFNSQAYLSIIFEHRYADGRGQRRTANIERVFSLAELCAGGGEMAESLVFRETEHALLKLMRMMDDQ